PFIALREIVKFGINLLTDWPECWRKIKIVGGAIKTAALAVKGFSDSIGLSQVLEGLYHLATFQIEAIIRGGMFVFQTAKNFSLLLTRQLSLKDFNNVQAHAGKKHLAALYHKVQKGTSTLGVGLKLLADVTGLLSAWGFLKHTALGIHEFGKPDGIRDDRKGAKDLIFGAAYLADAAIAIPTTVAAVTAAVGTGGLASWLSGCLMTLRVSWKMAAREVFYQARDYIGKKAAYRLAGRLSEREVAGAATEVMKDSVIELTKSALKKGGKVESSTLRALLEKHAERTMGQVYDRVDIQGICADITKEFLQEADKKSKNELVAMLLEMGITDPKRASELAHRTKWVVRSGRYSTQLQADIVHGIMRHVTQYMEAGLETECRNGMAMLLRGGRARAGGLSDLTNKALLKSADLAHASEVISGFLARESGGNTAKLFARDRARSAEIGRELASEFCELIESMVKKSESATRTFTEMAQAHKEEILEIEEAIRRLQLVPQREAEVMAQALHRAVRKGVPIRGETGISSGGGSLEDLMRGSFTNRINKMFRSDGAQQELAEECAKRALHGNTGEPVETIAERYARRYGDEIVEAHEKLIDDYIDEGWQGMRRGNRRALEPR
ncbi:MAG: hypothetical protein KDD42_09710, partial [Bdellovibrionales bacterium]|nr:hypothetical protein [Bdellovibrionales bacterium]